MELDNKVETCYMRQVKRNIFSPKPNSKGLRVNDEALVFFQDLPSGCPSSKLFYIKSLDTDGDGFLSLKEIAAAYQRADKNGNEERDDLGYISSIRDDCMSSKVESLNDFALHGAGPYLLSEAKKVNPAIYAQIEEKLKTGTFTITEELDDNPFRKKQRGDKLASSIIRATEEYEHLEKVSPDKKEVFFERLARGKALNFLRTTAEEPKEYSFEDEAIRNLCQKVFTSEKIKDYKSKILDIINDKQRLAKFLATVGEEIQNELKVKTTIVVSEKALEDNAAANFESKNKRINFSYPELIRVLNLNKGRSEDTIKNEMVKYIIFSILTHEYWHSEQFAMIENPPKNATPKQLATIQAWRQNSNNFITISKSMKSCGSLKDYATQPIEDSANHFNEEAERYFEQWLKIQSNN